MRKAFIATFVAVALVGLPSPAAAENGGETEQQTEIVGIFRAAFAEYRQALVALKEACGGAGGASDECASGMKELHSFVRNLKDMARETVERIHEERKAADEKARDEERAAKERAEQEAKERVKAEERAAEEARKAEKERIKAEEARKAAEKDKQKVEAAKKQPVQNVSVDASKRKEFIKNRLASLEDLIEFHRAEWERLDARLRELRDRLAQAPAGPERDRLGREVGETERASGNAADWFFKYDGEKRSLAAELDKLAKTVSQDVAKKVSKLEPRIKELEDTAAYKMGKHDEAHAQADEYRRIAAEKSGAEKDKYLRKAEEMDRQAAEWERLANEYLRERDALRAELDTLLGT